MRLIGARKVRISIGIDLMHVAASLYWLVLHCHHWELVADRGPRQSSPIGESPGSLTGTGLRVAG